MSREAGEEEKRLARELDAAFTMRAFSLSLSLSLSLSPSLLRTSAYTEKVRSPLGAGLDRLRVRRD